MITRETIAEKVLVAIFFEIINLHPHRFACHHGR